MYSLHRDDEPDNDGMLQRFPQYYHEPYFQSYLTEDFPAMARRCGLTHRRDGRAYISKVMVFDKNVHLCRYRKFARVLSLSECQFCWSHFARVTKRRTLSR